MKLIIRAFALGIVSATTIVSLTYFLVDTSPGIEKQQPEPSVKDMIKALEQEGYSIYSEEQIQPDLKDSTDAEIKNDQKDKIDQSETDIEENINMDPVATDSKTSTLNIEPGMTVTEIAKQLLADEIIDNAQAFRSYLEEHEYSTRIQIGQFSLDETMSHKQIAEIITK